MGKLAQATSKYIIVAHFDADGVVERPDIIGAVFGQTEGLLGADMDLRELQKTGRVGRIDVELKTVNGKTYGKIIIPSSLDASETSMIAACVETIERVGPCNARIRTEKIEDKRISKREYVVDRAQELLQGMFNEEGQEAHEISEQIKEAVRCAEVTEYRGLAAGPSIKTSPEIVIVEGRADIVNLLRCGIKNAIAIGGTSVPDIIKQLSKQKQVTAFLDGDRGGELILKELTSTCDIDFVAIAPEDKEVEDLTKKEIYKALRERALLKKFSPTQKPASAPKHTAGRQMRTRSTRHTSKKLRKRDMKTLKEFKSMLNDLIGTRAAYFLDDKKEILGKVPVREMFITIKRLEATTLVFDGEIDQKLVNVCSTYGIKNILGMRITDRVTAQENVQTAILKDLE